jgi:integrase
LSAASDTLEHHKALPYKDMAAFMAELSTRQGVDARALEFLILTAARTGEVHLARRSEIDFDAKLWTVPPGRIKGRKEHRVPLSDRAITLLKALPTEGDADGRSSSVVARTVRLARWR